MKRFFACLMALMLLVSLTGCVLRQQLPGQPAPTTQQTLPPEQTASGPTHLQVKLADHYLDDHTENYVPLATVSWQSAVLCEESARSYPDLARALEKWNDENRSYANEELQRLREAAKPAAQEAEGWFGGYTSTTRCAPERADTAILSLRCDYDVYSGGPRPVFATEALNVDPATGEELPVDAVITDYAGLPQLLEQALKAAHPHLEADTFEGAAAYLATYEPERYIWTMGYQGITFYFGAGELASGAVGEVKVTLWFDRYPTLVKEAYTQLPAAGYARVLSQTGSNQVILSEAAGDQELFVGITQENGVYIALGEERQLLPQIVTHYMEAYLVTADGKQFYLYIDAASDNDYRNLYIYSLSAEGVQLLDHRGGEGFRAVWQEDAYYTPVFNDPSAFMLSATVNILGTMQGQRQYAIDPATGLPETEMEAYEIHQTMDPLTSRVDLVLEQLPQKTEKTVPAGTRFYFLRTDNKTYMDMALADGTEYRIPIEVVNWQNTVNGMPEMECFDGLMYAG